MSVSHAVRQVT